MGDALSIGSLVRLLVSFGAVIGALLLIRRWGQRGSMSGRSALRVVARLVVARGSSVAVVAVGRRHLVVGASEHGVSLLAELDEEDLAALERNERTAAAAPGDRGSIDLAAEAFGPRSGRDTRPGTGLIGRLQRMTLRTSTRGPRGPSR